jgi:fructuronate reductase
MSGPVAPRLSLRTWSSGRSAAPLPYDRTAVPSIAHIGVGAFARAHLGVYADELLRQDWPALIRGVSIRSSRAADLLVPQDGLYTVSEREPGTDGTPRLIGAITQVESGVEAAVHAAGASTTDMVTLTISEKGYELDARDLEDPRHPQSAAGLLALALHCRRRAGIAAPVIVSMDNVLGNGTLLARRVSEIAALLDDGLPDWIAEEVRFPNSVVDRMVPATTDANLADVEAQLGLVDLAAVVSERHRSWVIEAADGLPPLADVGVEVVNSVVPFERRKLWLLNSPHSALAYCGLLAGCPTIATAAADPRIAGFVRRYVDDILEVADLPDAVDPHGFAIDALRRFANPALGHTCAQVGADGSRKLPQRLAAMAQTRHQKGLPTTRFATVIALWLAAVTGIRVGGRVLPPVEDPAAGALRGAARSGFVKLSHAALSEHFQPSMVDEVAAQLKAVVRHGMAVIDQPR